MIVSGFRVEYYLCALVFADCVRYRRTRRRAVCPLNGILRPGALAFTFVTLAIANFKNTLACFLDSGRGIEGELISQRIIF
jgi:hypothetical protein